MKVKYLVAIAIGVILTPDMVARAFIERECFAVGGEWLLTPLLLMIVCFFDSMRELWRCTNEKGKQEKM